MNNKERQKFRQSKFWKDKRKEFREKYKSDPITGSKLTKMYNLHHLNADKDNYDKPSDDELLPLNQQTHKVVHILYRWYCKDKTIVERLIALVEKMYEINNGKNF